MINDSIRLDDHKLYYHPERVSKHLKGNLIYPILVEISPVGFCNHRCIFCALDYMGYKPISIDTKVIKDTLSNMAKVGVKSIHVAGEGEPLLHKDIREIINHIKATGMDIGLTTNGVMLTENMWRYIGNSLSWVKVSLDAGTSKTHAMIHGTSEDDFDKIIDNLRYAVKIKKTYDWKCVIGVQSILLNENMDELKDIAVTLRDIGVDYFTIKPFTDSKLRIGGYQETPLYKEKFVDELESVTTKDFKVIFRKNTFNNLYSKRDYDECPALEFITYISSTGDVFPCCSFVVKKFSYANIYNNSFEDIWKNKKGFKPNVHKCRITCRGDKINQYLHDIKYNKIEHANFI